jgi:hypothetical protein
MIVRRQLAAAVDVVAGTDPPPLAASVAARVAALWQAAQRDCGGIMFDGRILTLTERAPGRLAGHFVPYSWFVAQKRDPALVPILDLRPLAVSGILTIGNSLVFGLRGRDVVADRGLWELAPSGSVDIQALRPDGTVDAAGLLLREAVEELNVDPAWVNGLQPIALLDNGTTRVNELCFAARLDCTPEQLCRAFAGRNNREYDELRLVPARQLTAFVAAHAIDPGSVALLDAAGHPCAASADA